MIAALILVVCIVVGAVIWFVVGQQQKTHRIGQALDELGITQTYSEVHSQCVSQEGLLACERGYLPTASLSTVRSEMIQKLKTAGYTVYDIPHGYDGPDPTFFARNTSTAIVVKTVSSDNTAYEKAYGTLQLTAFASNDIADNKFDLGVQL